MWQTILAVAIVVGALLVMSWWFYRALRGLPVDDIKGCGGGCSCSTLVRRQCPLADNDAGRRSASNQDT